MSEQTFLNSDGLIAGIASLAQEKLSSQVVDVDGRKFLVTQNGAGHIQHREVYDPMPETLRARTLQGLVQLAEQHQLADGARPLVAQIVSPVQVELLERDPDDRARRVRAGMVLSEDQHPVKMLSGSAMDVTEAIDNLMIHAKPIADQPVLLEILKVLTVQDGKEITSDGVMSTVTIKDGLSAGTEIVSPFYMLEMRRGFHDVHDVQQAYKLRLEKSGMGVQVYLQATQEARWQYDTINHLADRLRALIADSSVDVPVIE